MGTQRKAFRLFITIFLVLGVLAATHEGEFWPFSIYPMFSQAGNTWTRSMVRDISESQLGDSTLEKTITELENLPGKPFPLNEIGINQNDVSGIIQKAENWNTARKKRIYNLFDKGLENKELVIYKVQGRLSSENRDSVTISYTPFLKVSPDSMTVY